MKEHYDYLLKSAGPWFRKIQYSEQEHRAVDNYLMYCLFRADIETYIAGPMENITHKQIIDMLYEIWQEVKNESSSN